MPADMDATLVLQSHRTPLPYTWIENCLESVRDWCALRGYQYRFLGDELFDPIPPGLRGKLGDNNVMASDLARLCCLRQALKDGFERVVWLDADMIVFAAERFVLPDADCAVGREVWVQEDRAGRLKTYKKVHNAFLMFRAGNSFLDFYTDTAVRLLTLNSGPAPPQFIGPKLLTALHNIAQLPVLENAAMLSPAVIGDVIRGGGAALELFRRHSPVAPAAANLCISSCERGDLSAQDMEEVIDRLPDTVLSLSA